MSMHLHRDLERLKKSLLSMGAMVEEATDKAISSLVDRRVELAQEVINGDDAIDRKEIQVEDECLKMLALHQPVAADLRFIVVVMKVNNDLERMGDLAANIAERVMFLAKHEPIGVPLDFEIMAHTVRAMVAQALDSLVNRNPEAARQVLKLDDEVDTTHRKMYAILQDRMREDPAVIERAVQTLSASRHLERIADLATNIAEDVVFMVEGNVIRHARSAPQGASETNSRPRPTSGR
ncbi:MAG: phosphate signaling complex protein PhoU [Planctomycetota bacterium]